MTVAIDNRSIRREAVLPNSNSIMSARYKVEPDDVTRKTYIFSTHHCVDMTFRPTPRLLSYSPEIETELFG